MEANPLVSIVTPSYNKGRFIEETILSVKNQTYPRIEHIIVDGGSSDGTLDILRKYNDSVVWKSEPDKGQSDGINKGWKMCKGEILAYLNADDTYLPQAVETAVSYLNEHQDVGLVYGECNIIDMSGKVISEFGAEEFKLEQILLGGGCPIPQPASFFRKAILDEIGYLDTNLHMAMDLDFWVRTALKFKVQLIPHVLANFRTYPNTKSSSEILHTFWHDRLTIIEKTFSNPNLPDNIKVLKEQALRHAVYAIDTDAAFHIGRLELINGEWQEARSNFNKVMTKAHLPLRLKALFGLICSYFKVDMEWMAAILCKPRMR